MLARTDCIALPPSLPPSLLLDMSYLTPSRSAAAAAVGPLTESKESLEWRRNESLIGKKEEEPCCYLEILCCPTPRKREFPTRFAVVAKSKNCCCRCCSTGEESQCPNMETATSIQAIRLKASERASVRVRPRD